MADRGWLCLLGLTALLAGCAEPQPRETGALSSYSGLQKSDGLLTKSKISIRAPEVMAARTARILPTTISQAIHEKLPAADERALLANAVDRSLCASLSERFEITPSNVPADLTIRANIADLAPTDPVAAGASKVATVGIAFVAAGVPVPRIPIGLGSVSIEAEALDMRGTQLAAMVWGRGANAFTSPARISSSGDAYDLTNAFSEDFSRLLVTGKNPFENSLPSMPTAQRISENFGGAPRHAACEAFGRNPGLIGAIGSGLGLPPDWGDKGAATTKLPAPSRTPE